MEGKLSKKSYLILNSIVLDLKSTLPPSLKVYNKKDNEAIIYNMFKGDYKFSFNQYKEIINFLYK